MFSKSDGVEPEQMFEELNKPKADKQKINIHRGADKFLIRPGRKQAAATEDFDVHISYL
jgi:hypothetical protein